MTGSPMVALAPRMLRLWVLAAALLSGLGWLLSFLRALNWVGYLLTLPFILASLFWFVWTPAPFRLRPARLLKRFARPFPLAYLCLAFLAALGGFLYLPNNYDALAYRIPRVLNWVAEGHWHWIPNFRGWQNTRGCGFEWTMAPILALAKSDRCLFLLNLAGYLLLPGLTFSVLTRVGVRARVAWHWMWLFPTGLCFILQAGSMANDLYGAIFAMAAIDFALRAQCTQRPQDLFYSILAAACMTNAKASNLPLLLPWAIAIFPSMRLLLLRPIASFAVIVLASFSSLLPTTILNVKYAGDWTGLKAEMAPVLPSDSFAAVRHNTALLLLQNLTPPIFPLASRWNNVIEQRIPFTWKNKLQTFAEDGWRSYKQRELSSEEYAGLGFGISSLLMLQFLIAVQHRPLIRRLRASGSTFSSPLALKTLRMYFTRSGSTPPWLSRASPFWRQILLLAPFFSLAVFMAKSGLAPAARTVSPYYGLLLPSLLLVSDFPGLLRLRIWRWMAGLCFGWAFACVILTPARPLWPAKTVLSSLQSKFTSPVLEKAQTAYDVYRNRQDHFAVVRRLLPDDSNIGFVTTSDAETSLWRPFGRRRVYDVLRSTTPEDLIRLNVGVLIINMGVAEQVLGMTFQEWLAKTHGEIMTSVSLKILASNEPIKYTIVKLPLNSGMKPRTAGLGEVR